MRMTSASPTLEAIVYKNNELHLLNQLLLPHSTVYEKVNGVEDGYHQIKDMKVRGAPAIAITGALCLAVELKTLDISTYTPSTFLPLLEKYLTRLKQSRPTAVNLTDACNKIQSIASSTAASSSDVSVIIFKIVEFAESMLEDDKACNHRIGEYGSSWIISKLPSNLQKEVKVLTHCNTGSLATGGYGTALGIIRSLHSSGSLKHAYCTETRPYNQGSRLTAYELVFERIPSTLITDSMVSFLLSTSQKSGKPISAIIVGADRIAANGDTANKIGTYQLAVTAKHHNVLMIVAATISTIDLTLPNGQGIPIEERKKEELVRVSGVKLENGVVGDKIETVQVAPKNVEVWNPGFDVTPASMIDAIVTEFGVCVKEPGKDYFDLTNFVKSCQLKN